MKHLADRLLSFLLSRRSMFAFNRMLLMAVLRGLGRFSKLRPHRVWAGFAKPPRLLRACRVILARPFVAGSGTLCLGTGNWRSNRGERLILRLFSRQLGREAVVLDIGADCGKNAALAGAAFPEARTFAFEPHPANHAELRGVASSLGFEAVRVGRATRRRASESLDDVPQDPRLPSYPPLGPPLGPTVRLRDLYGSLSALLGIGDVYGVMLCEKDGALMRIYKTTGTVGHTCARNFSYIVCD